MAVIETALLRNPGSRFIDTVDLEAVANALARRLIGYVLARTGCRGTAEDIAQDALTALVRRWRQIGPPESPDAFAFAIAKRRAGRAVARRALMAPIDALRNRARDEPGVDQSYDDRHELSRVLSAVRALPRIDREALLGGHMKRLAIVIIVVSGFWMSAGAAQGPLDARVTIDYRNTPGVDVITTLAHGVGLSVQVGSGSLRPVPIALTNVKLSNALNALCDNALCLWSLVGSVLRVTPLPSDKSASLPPVVSFELHDTTATEVFRALAAAINVPVTIEPGFSSEPISFNFTNAATADVLNILCNLQHCEWDFDPARGLRVTQKRVCRLRLTKQIVAR